MFVEVILPVPLADTYTYQVPVGWEEKIVPGLQVFVEFGRKRYSGVIAAIRLSPPESSYEVKPLLELGGDSPVVRESQLRFFEWLADYYLCSRGEVFKAVLPSRFRYESSRHSVVPRESYVRWGSACDKSSTPEDLLQLLKRALRQRELLSCFIRETSSLAVPEITEKLLLSKSGANRRILSELTEKGILESFEREVVQSGSAAGGLKPLNRLTLLQEEALRNMKGQLLEKEVCLLYGVTSSGKTEIYMHLMEEALQSGRQVLFLLPEIALTKHLTERLSSFFGDKLTVYHSGINQNKRIEIWNSLLADSGARIVVGVRSAVFLPFDNLGLVVVDEEHEPSFKQQSPAPRYHGRNAAIVLASIHGAKTVLGSATPSMESYYNAQSGKYGLVTLSRHFEDTSQSLITPVNIKELRRKKRMNGLFSPDLIEKIEERLERGEQILLFQNRRGFSPLIACPLCDWTPRCKYCDVSLTLHKMTKRMCCHYCGNTYRIPEQCPECGNSELKPLGFGTEKVEEEVRLLFPGISVERMDSDTTRSTYATEEIFSRFESGETRILVGTQMVSKGLDFGNVGLVGILNADSLMNFPDFRAHERTYQLLLQVAGRSGRRGKQGEVLLQTSHPDHPLIRMVLAYDYAGMYRMQAEERQLFRYPPFYRLIRIILKSRKEQIAESSAARLAEILTQRLGDRVLGPDVPPVGRVQNQFIRNILLKIENNASLKSLYQILEKSRGELSATPEFKYVSIQYDVDPV